MASPFSILAICRANIARSYVAERLLVSELEKVGLSDTTVTVSSRGTHVHPEVGIAEEIGELVTQRGGTITPHVPTQLTSSDLESADLVLVAEETTHNDLFHLLPSPSPHAFTLIQFARLISEIDWEAVAPVRKVAPRGTRPKILRESVEVIDRYRGYLPPDDISLDIPDPAGSSLQVLTETADTIHTHVRTVARWCSL
jgi:protein-tyrosine phosphatase